MLDFPKFKEKYNYDAATPMIQQYLDIKFEHQEALLLYRMGDFYELFFDDAKVASKALGLALAKRGKHGEGDLPMCGVPHHSLTSYLHKLVEDGFIVAICDQLETPEEAKKRGYKAIVKRGVTRIITPGTITEESILPANSANYLASITFEKENAILSYLDVSTSEFKSIRVTIARLPSELSRISPKEVIIAESSLANYREIFAPYNAKLVIQVDSYFATSKSMSIIERFYNIHSVSALGTLSNAQISSIAAILEYVNITQKSNPPELGFPKVENSLDYMEIDASTRRNLEISSTISGSYKGSLLSNINLTITKMGARLLHSYLSTPLKDVRQINDRLDKVDFFYSNMEITVSLREILKNISDIERILIRISMRRSIPRDLLSLRDSLIAANDLCDLLPSSLSVEQSSPEISKPDSHSFFSGLPCNVYGFLAKISEMITQAINPDAPNNISAGGIINKSYNKRLVELYDILENSDEYIHRLKLEYQERTGIDNLKITHNNIIGTFIEVTPKNAHKMEDPEFIHKQTLASAVRYTSERLKNIESDKMNARGEAIILEQQIFGDICTSIMEQVNNLRELASEISRLDVFSSLAKLAKDNNYVKPEIDESTDFEIVGGRHVNVEQNLPSGEFIPNDCNLNRDNRLWLITGPNMAGKSTFLRQNALIIILAQMGSFVPAEYAKIGIVDKLFSRIGASDDIASGQSTFMVEMVETAAILSNSTEKSFIILDEIGRGTSTYDGLSIAWGCLEYIHNDLRSRCLFATHYHELTVLAKTEPALKNYTVDISEDDGIVTFLHKVIPGMADRSYGIHVAELAGLPRKVIKRAGNVLKTLAKDADKKKIDDIMSNNYSLFYDVPTKFMSEIEKKLQEIKPDELSPKEALEVLYSLKKEMV